MTTRALRFWESLVARRTKGEPLQYVLGVWPFRALELMVDRRVLIPRPETETVVEVALGELDRIRAGRPPADRLTVVDLGTGSGAIALSIATERPGVDVWATDVAPDALDVARANLAGMGGHAAARVRMVAGTWWAALPADLAGRLDLVVSNPPYITTAEMADLDPVVTDWEPRRALEAGPDGLEDVSAILTDASRWLRVGGGVVLEMAPHQTGRAADLARALGFDQVEIHCDLAGRPRTLVVRLLSDRP